MVFSKSITFDGEETGRAIVPGRSDATGFENELFIEKLKAGDAIAFDTLIERYSGDVYSLLYRLTDGADEAADITQDTFLRAFRSIKSFRGDSSLKTWLYRIAVNESRNRFRWWNRRRRDQTISIDAKIGDTATTIGDLLADKGSSPEENAILREREYALIAAVNEMSANFREVIVLCDIEGLSYEDAAIAAGINSGTLRSRLSRAREELRHRLKDF